MTKFSESLQKSAMVSMNDFVRRELSAKPQERSLKYIDYSPSSTTAQDSFYGTVLSLNTRHIQDRQGETDIVIIEGTSNVRTVGQLPRQDSNVQPVTPYAKNPFVPPFN